MSASYDPLYGPDDTTPAPESLAVEIAVTRRILDETAVLNIHDDRDMLKAAVALNCRVRGLLAALDAERGEGK
ncbi:hypothetical protein OG819_22255 [Streptomyces sp. NBC_01549]|uniref:hypothetical protein n=1 Tax=Streptomyces sp. NBC_01549 TaxID=2975874 RepID=UPI0022500A99|nr:hypothetical protein [Streptomyces sp. NBC_01549]MCX4592354.1 hypothetical protein [Streptomyces sp. NBC_01549]